MASLLLLYNENNIQTNSHIPKRLHYSEFPTHIVYSQPTGAECGEETSTLHNSACNASTQVSGSLSGPHGTPRLKMRIKYFRQNYIANRPEATMIMFRAGICANLGLPCANLGLPCANPESSDVHRRLPKASALQQGRRKQFLVDPAAN